MTKAPSRQHVELSLDVWRERNCFNFNGKLRSASEIVDWAVNVLLKFKDTIKVFRTKANCSKRESQVIWSPPPPKSLKLNSDVAVQQNSHHIGAGVVIGDWEGKVVIALSKALPRRYDAEPSEFLALIEGLLLAKNLGLEFGCGVGGN
ncbi:hypothetical protein Dsin_028638 [Dipteronia sinensis]|uniref:RNase H type-1 domain-containing protein n=1 Tax=Dipteronia sinensis TaxID=43782 RepID=A0AAD9ZR71_9ROSI|nr:hypothetical protein Dsin_028638 [Dipteronia sinensis]